VCVYVCVFVCVSVCVCVCGFRLLNQISSFYETWYYAMAYCEVVRKGTTLAPLASGI
jgi:hypothetical protein